LKSKFLNIVIKELKDLLRDPRILVMSVIIPVIMFIGLGAMFQVTVKKGIEEVRRIEVSVVLVDLDKGDYAEAFKKFIKMVNASYVEAPSLNEAMKIALEKGVLSVIVIPEGFSKNISNMKPGVLKIYHLISEVSFTATGLRGKVEALVNRFSRTLSQSIALAHGITNLNFIVKPVVSDASIMFRGRSIPLQLWGSLTGSFMATAWIPLIVVIFAASMAATSIGVEKEEKTLEVLLTLPISRFKLALSKFIGTMIIAIIQSIAYVAGYTYYMYSIFKSFESEASGALFSPFQALRWLALSISDLALIGLAIFLTILLGASLGLLLGSFGTDVRSSTSMVQFVAMPAFIIGMILAYMDLSIMPETTRYTLALLPFSSPIMSIKSIFINEPILGWVSCLASTCYTIVAIYGMSRMFSSERLLIGRIKARRKTLLAFRSR